MIGIVLGLFSGFLRSKIFNLILKSKYTPVVLVILAAFIWHKYDKSSAVKKAVVEYIADVELEAVRTQLAVEQQILKEVRRRELVAVQALDTLEKEFETQQESALLLKKEIEDYRATISPDNIIPIDSDIFNSLRNK